MKLLFLFCGLCLLYCADPYRLLTLTDKLDARVKASYGRYQAEHPEKFPKLEPAPARDPDAPRKRLKRRKPTSQQAAPAAPKPADESNWTLL